MNKYEALYWMKAHFIVGMVMGVAVGWGIDYASGWARRRRRARR